MPKNDDADTPISIRVPKELRQQIKDYAEANKLYRAGSANLSGALILIAREFFSGNVAQSSATTDFDNVAQSNLDFDSKIDNAIAAKLNEIKDEIKEEYGAGFRGISANITDLLLLQQRDREIDELKQTITPLLARLEAVETKLSTEATAPANFPSALLQKVKEVAPLKLKEAA
jgi:hypothetical protein